MIMEVASFLYGLRVRVSRQKIWHKTIYIKNKKAEMLHIAIVPANLLHLTIIEL